MRGIFVNINNEGLESFISELKAIEGFKLEIESSKIAVQRIRWTSSFTDQFAKQAVLRKRLKLVSTAYTLTPEQEHVLNYVKRLLYQSKYL